MPIAKLFRDGTVFAAQEQRCRLRPRFGFSRDRSMISRSATHHEQASGCDDGDNAKLSSGGATMLPASRRTDGAWMKLDDQGRPPADLLSADIYDSWMRCITLGLDALRPPSPEFVDAALL